MLGTVTGRARAQTGDVPGAPCPALAGVGACEVVLTVLQKPWHKWLQASVATGHIATRQG